MDIEQIRKAATDFRNAIEACTSKLDFAFNLFPSGSCGDTTAMLGTYLIVKYLGEFQYMSGNYGKRESGNWSSHAWLQSIELVIDITAGQFPEITEKVIVKKESEWHQQLKGVSLGLADYRIRDAHLRQSYQQIVAFIDE